jgi:hypothetical protein
MSLDDVRSLFWGTEAGTESSGTESDGSAWGNAGGTGIGTIERGPKAAWKG